MEFTIKQINELITGVELAVELPSHDNAFRRFITVLGIVKDKIINEEKRNTTAFFVRDYEVKSTVIENDLDDCDADYRNSTTETLVGIKKLQEYLLQKTNDLSAFVPIWESNATI